MAGTTSILPIIAARTSPIITLPIMDLKLHLLDVFIKLLHSWIDSNRLFGLNIILIIKCYQSFNLVFPMFPRPEYCIGNLLLLIRHTVIERLKRRDQLLHMG